MSSREFTRLGNDSLNGDQGNSLPSGRSGGGKASGPNPTDRGKPGSKHHLLTDARGTPLVAQLTAANGSDDTMLLDLVDAIPHVRGIS